MNMPLKLVKVGNSTGIVLPREVLVRMGVQQGDMVNLAGLDDRSFTLRPADDNFEAQMAAAREVMARRRRALRELAK